MSMTTTVSVALSECQKVATVKISSQSAPIVCGCLGVEFDPSGNVNKIYLDSLIHRARGKGKYIGWHLSGAISTIATVIQ